MLSQQVTLDIKINAKTAAYNSFLSGKVFTRFGNYQTKHTGKALDKLFNLPIYSKVDYADIIN